MTKKISFAFICAKKIKLLIKWFWQWFAEKLAFLAMKKVHFALGHEEIGGIVTFFHHFFTEKLQKSVIIFINWCNSWHGELHVTFRRFMYTI